MIRLLSLGFLIRWKIGYGPFPDILCSMILNSAPVQYFDEKEAESSEGSTAAVL